MFTAALATIAKMLKQPNCPSTEEWVKTMWYSHTVKHHSAFKKRILFEENMNEP